MAGARLEAVEAREVDIDPVCLNVGGESTRGGKASIADG